MAEKTPASPLTRYERNIKKIQKELVRASIANPTDRKIDDALTALSRITSASSVVVRGRWKGSQNILPEGTKVDILSIDFVRYSFAESACWVRWNSIGDARPKYLSCDLRDVDLDRLDELSLFDNHEMHDWFIEALKEARTFIVSDTDDTDEKLRVLKFIDRMLGIYEESESQMGETT